MKKFLLYLLSFAILSLGLSSCRDEDNGGGSDTATINFTTKIGLSNETGDYQIGDSLKLSTGYEFNLKKFKLYLSNITLVGASSEREIKDIMLADVGDASTGAFSASIPVGNYREIRLGYGLDPQQNNQNPEDFDRDHPLSSWNQMYWTMLKYRFAILEGRSDTIGELNGDASDILNAYHPGTDSLYRVVTYPISLNLNAGDSQTIELRVLLDQLFAAGEGIDMRSEPQTHSELGSPAVPGDFYIAKKFMDNLSETTQIATP